MLTKEEYKKILVRMWDENRTEYKGHPRCAGVECDDCILHGICSSDFGDTEGVTVFDALDLVEQWGKEHPIVTNMDKFEEIFGFRPNVFLRDEAVSICDGYHRLDDTFWNAEYKKEEASEQEPKGREKYYIVATDIDWDVDEEDAEYFEFDMERLPKTVYIPDDIEEEDIVDWLSDTYGWCVSGFVLERKSKNTDKIDALTY